MHTDTSFSFKKKGPRSSTRRSSKSLSYSSSTLTAFGTAISLGSSSDIPTVTTPVQTEGTNENNVDGSICVISSSEKRTQIAHGQTEERTDGSLSTVSSNGTPNDIIPEKTKGTHTQSLHESCSIDGSESVQLEEAPWKKQRGRFGPVEFSANCMVSRSNGSAYGTNLGIYGTLPERYGELGISQTPHQQVVNRVVEASASHVICPTTPCQEASTSEQSAQASPSLQPKGKTELAKKLDVKHFLSTGLLEGRVVTYIKKGKVKLPGIIKDSGYLCGCTSCNYSRTISAVEFEKHAGVTTSNQNGHIFLENGLSLYNLVKELKRVTIDSLSEELQRMIGQPANAKCYALWKDLFQSRTDELYEHSAQFVVDMHVQQESCDQLHHSCRSPPCQRDFSWMREPTDRTQEVGTAHCENNRSQKSLELSYLPVATTNPHQPKMDAQSGSKKRDHNLPDLLFSENGLPDGTSLTYIANGQAKLTGYKSKNSIVYDCCNEEMNPSKFDAHAGFASRQQPYNNIYPVDGQLSLYQLALKLSEGCLPALNVSVPHDKWCSLECERSQMASTNKHICLRRVLKDLGDSGCCVLCKANFFSVGEFNAETIILCYQCEKEYHVGCLKRNNICNLEIWPGREWFCSADCHSVHGNLMKFASGGPMMIPQQPLTKVKMKPEVKGLAAETGWELLSGRCKPLKYRLLSQTIDVIKNGFYPITESQHDLIPAIVYGKEIVGHAFEGFYSVILTVRSLIVSVGMLRIFGKDIAELPLVVTLERERGKGYLRLLLSMIEGLLCFLNVKRLILPADDSTLPMWIDKFGFVKITDKKVRECINEVPILLFEGTTLLEKDVSDVCWAS